MDYDYPCNFTRPVSEQLHNSNSSAYSKPNPRASSFSTYSNSSFSCSSTSSFDSSSSSSSSLVHHNGAHSSGHLASSSPSSPAYVSVGFTTNSGGGNSSSKQQQQSALFSSLLSKHTNGKSGVQLESVVPLVPLPPKHRVAAGIYYDMPKNIPVDPRWAPNCSTNSNSSTNSETPKFPVAAISTPNLYDRPQLPEKSSAVQSKQSMLSLASGTPVSSHKSTLPVIVGASMKATVPPPPVMQQSQSMQSITSVPPPLSVNTSAYMSTMLGFKQSSTAKPLPPLPGSSAGKPSSLLKSTPPPPPPPKPFSAAAVAAATDASTNYDVLPAKNTAVHKTADQVDCSVSAKPSVPAPAPKAAPYKFTSIYSKNYVKSEDEGEEDDDEDEEGDYDYDYVCLESKKKLDDEDAGIRRTIPREFQTRYEKLALGCFSGGSGGSLDLSHLERQMQAHSLSPGTNTRLSSNSSSAVKRQLLASYRQYLSAALVNFEHWISLTLEIIERSAHQRQQQLQPSVYINFAKHILLSGQNLLLVAKSLNRHYSQLRSLATFADSFYEYLRVIVLKTKRAAAGAGGSSSSGAGSAADRQAVTEMVDSIKGALRFASHLKVELIQ